ncbi:flagellin [Pedomonas mirosovicensis]|uniref:flagellin n=1 Tax=Pedomonas mirosovicensis TaxID=2908641 RepID=UPI002167C186|nr:flagellin [Pedomonas mirosovicensis]MCH8685091.1 flagellin [Pedomonas mirosovicensis]
MTLSINTNAAALNALQSLNRTTTQLEDTQLRINTGLEVNSAKDNAAIFAIAQNLRADRQGLEAVKSSLDRATSVLDISMAAAESIQELLIEMKEKVTQAADAGLPDDSREALQEDFERLRDQIVTIAKNATFNGTNMIDGPANPPTKPAELVALVSVDATLKIQVPRQNLQLAPATTTPAAGDAIQLAQDTTFTDATEAEALISAIDASIKNVSESLTVMGAGSNSMDRQRTFIDKLGDTVETGIGNMVDADMARESAMLQALQVKQQLGTQALSIANQQPQAILSLFGNG